MTLLLFDGKEEPYWWILCFEKFFKEHGTHESLKVLKAVGALRGSALKWWIWWSRIHRRYNWDTFTTALLWRFKPEWQEILPISDEKEEPIEESPAFMEQCATVDAYYVEIFDKSDIEISRQEPLTEILFNEEPITMVEVKHKQNDFPGSLRNRLQTKIDSTPSPLAFTVWKEEKSQPNPFSFSQVVSALPPPPPKPSDSISRSQTQFSSPQLEPQDVKLLLPPPPKPLDPSISKTTAKSHDVGDDTTSNKNLNPFPRPTHYHRHSCAKPVRQNSRTKNFSKQYKMYVVKRDGLQETVHFNKTMARLKQLNYGLHTEKCDLVLVSQKVCAGVYRGVTTSHLDELAAESDGEGPPSNGWLTTGASTDIDMLEDQVCLAEDTICIALLPDSDSKHEAVLDRYSFCYPVSGDAILREPFCVEYKWEKKDWGDLLLLAHPLHLQFLFENDMNNVTILNDSKYKSIDDQLVDVVCDSWIFKTEHISITWYSMNGVKEKHHEEIISSLFKDVEGLNSSSIKITTCHVLGKLIVRAARLSLITEEVFFFDVIPKVKVKKILTETIEPWLERTFKGNGFLYDKKWVGIVTKQGYNDSNGECGFGIYNTHHYTSGYFVYAIAMLGKIDPAWGRKNKAQAYALLEDFLNLSKSMNSNYSRLRCFDIYNLHSWAEGLTEFADGRNQMGSSEVVTAYYAATLFGMAYGVAQVVSIGSTFAALEICAAEMWWHVNFLDKMTAAFRLADSVVLVVVYTMMMDVHDRCRTKSHYEANGQVGVMVDVNITVDLWAHEGYIVKEVSSKDLKQIRDFTIGDYAVLLGPWLGRIDYAYAGYMPFSSTATVDEQSQKNLKGLSCFTHANWQLGDWHFNERFLLSLPPKFCVMIVQLKQWDPGKISSFSYLFSNLEDKVQVNPAAMIGGAIRYIK